MAEEGGIGGKNDDWGYGSNAGLIDDDRRPGGNRGLGCLASAWLRGYL